MAKRRECGQMIKSYGESQAVSNAPETRMTDASALTFTDPKSKEPKIELVVDRWWWSKAKWQDASSAVLVV